jgi:hypothetical protein
MNQTGSKRCAHPGSSEEGISSSLAVGIVERGDGAIEVERGQWQRGVHQHLSGVNGNAHGMQLSRWSPAGRRRG